MRSSRLNLQVMRLHQQNSRSFNLVALDTHMEKLHSYLYLSALNTNTNYNFIIEVQKKTPSGPENPCFPLKINTHAHGTSSRKENPKSKVLWETNYRLPSLSPLTSLPSRPLPLPSAVPVFFGRSHFRAQNRAR